MNFNIDYLCLDCGNMEGAPSFIRASKEMYQGQNKLAIKFAIRDKMTYLGCSECKSPNIFFSKEQNVGTSEDDVVFDEEDVCEDLEQENDIANLENKEEQPQATRKTKMEPKMAPPSIRTRSSMASSIGGQDTTGNTYVAREVPEHMIASSDVPNDMFKISDKQVVERRRYKRICRYPDCRSKFETKDQYQLYCTKCLKGYAGRSG